MRSGKLAMLFLFLVALSGCSSHVTDFSGYYYNDQEITSIATGESTIERSWLRILTGEDGRYEVTGRIVGTNYHICEIAGEDGPLPMVLIDDALVFTDIVDTSDGQAACSLSIRVVENFLVIEDRGGCCSRWLFGAGAGISADGYRFSTERYSDN